MKKILLLVLLMGLVFGGCSTSNKEINEFVLVQMPNENNPNAGTQHEAFRSALEKDLGIKVTEMEGTDYSVGIEAMANGKIDVMLVSPFSYFQAKERANAELLVSTPILENYRTVFIVKKDSSINTLKDLKGKTFAFVDQASSSGYLYPKSYLVNELKLDANMLESSGYFFDTVTFSGKHDASVMGVSMGDYDGAAVAEAVLEQMVNAGVINKDQFKIIGETEVIPNPAYIIRGDLPKEIKDKVRSFFLNYQDESYFKDIHGKTDVRFVEVEESSFDVVKEMMETLHMEAK